MDPEESPEQLREYLAHSLSRLEQLNDLHAAESLMDHERQVARRLMTKLLPSDADAVLRAWPRGAMLLDGPTASGHRPN